MEVVPYRAMWPGEFEALATRIAAALGELAVAIDHIGSTSVPGLAAKDVIDVQVRVATLDLGAIVERFERIGFRRRPEPWNNVEVSFGHECEKLVFAPPVGERFSKIHVRVDGAPNARFALLFRDYLRSNDDVRDAWGAFKASIAQDVPDLAAYGQVKAPATDALMAAATAWDERVSGRSASWVARGASVRARPE